MFSKACEYGIKSCIYLITQSLRDKKISLKDISQEINSPEAFTSKILQLLVKKELIISYKGPAGGFYIHPEKLKQILLIDIVSAIDGDNIFRGCALGLEQCNEKMPCPVHEKFKLIRDDLKEMLATTTIYELSLGLHEGLTYLKR
ncbi:MAG TPA: Rrf2 family transcriptional regulator [Saprospiraceae bacterium]|nr:Rrf2 family transcriptional regulator [Saprospiraceae bacterium]